METHKTSRQIKLVDKITMKQMEEQLERDTYVTDNKCPFCTDDFLLSWELESHLKSEHPTEVQGFECIECNEKFTLRQDFVAHQKIHGGTTYVCNYCPAIFKDKIHYDNHRIKDHPNSNYDCPDCRKKFQSPASLEYHSRYHNPALKLRCRFCDRQFKRTYHLVGHERRSHTFEKPYLCAYCGKDFYAKLDLDIHNFKHENNNQRPKRRDTPNGKRHECKQCDKVFFVKFTFENHVKQHHSNERPFKCKHCDKAFSVQMNCKLHEKRHSEEYNKTEQSKKEIYKCALCDKTTMNPLSMDQHLKSHTDPLKIKCDECYDFFKPDYMRIHKLRVHRKTIRHTCDVRNSKTIIQFINKLKMMLKL